MSKKRARRNNNNNNNNPAPQQDWNFAIGFLILTGYIVAVCVYDLYYDRTQAPGADSIQSSKESAAAEEVQGRSIDSQQRVVDNCKVSTVLQYLQEEGKVVTEMKTTCVHDTNSFDGSKAIELSPLLFLPSEISTIMEEMLSQDPVNYEVLFNHAVKMHEDKRYPQCIELMEHYLQLRLGLTSWMKLVESIIDQREDEWSFLYDIGYNVTTYLDMILLCYLKEFRVTEVRLMYRLIIGLKGAVNAAQHTKAYSNFALGVGDVWTALEQTRLNTVQLFVDAGLGDEYNAHKVVTAHGVRLFGAGFTMHINTITRNLLVRKHEVWSLLKEACKLEHDPLIRSSVTYSKVYFREIADIYASCVLHQDVLRRLVESGGVVYSANRFGWVPLLQAAFLGEERILKEMLAVGADPLAKTELGHNVLHILTMHGGYSALSSLRNAGLVLDDTDYFNRTALDIACLQGQWSAEPLVQALGMQLPPNCPSKPVFHQGGQSVSNGGWLPSHVALPPELTDNRCDFDAVVDLTAESFLYDYLILQRPVLVRNALNSSLVSSFLQRWERNNFESIFGDVSLRVGIIPLASQLGQPERRIQISSLLPATKDLHTKKRPHSGKDTPYAADAFELIAYSSVGFDSPFLEGFEVPPVLDSNTTYILYESILGYVYIGTALGGFNMAFGKQAWDLLVYGQKRWFLLPPADAYFATEQPWMWWKNVYRAREEGGALECVQRSGDLLFIPELWSRASIHLRESVGILQEFVHGATEFSI